jgi:hypothetical protein
VDRDPRSNFAYQRCVPPSDPYSMACRTSFRDPVPRSERSGSSATMVCTMFLPCITIIAVLFHDFRGTKLKNDWRTRPIRMRSKVPARLRPDGTPCVHAHALPRIDCRHGCNHRTGEIGDDFSGDALNTNSSVISLHSVCTATNLENLLNRGIVSYR